jgi:hypothetical protein
MAEIVKDNWGASFEWTDGNAAKVTQPVQSKIQGNDARQALVQHLRNAEKKHRNLNFKPLPLIAHH